MWSVAAEKEVALHFQNLGESGCVHIWNPKEAGVEPVQRHTTQQNHLEFKGAPHNGGQYADWSNKRCHPHQGSCAVRNLQEEDL